MLKKSGRRWLLGMVSAIIALPALLFAYCSWQYPVTTSAAVLAVYEKLPLGAAQHPATWSLLSAYFRAEIDSTQPYEVERELAGKNGKRPAYLIVALGDSTTKGHGVLPVDTWAWRLQKSIGNRLHKSVRVVNAGINGDIAANGLDRLERDVLALKPDLAIVGYLINDGRVFGLDAERAGLTIANYDDFAAAMGGIVEKLQSKSIPVMLLTCHPIQPAFFGFDRLDWSVVQEGIYANRVNALRVLAGQKQIPLADSFAAVTQAQDPSALYLGDNIHLNAEGHRLVYHVVFNTWAENFHPQLGKPTAKEPQATGGSDE